MIIESVGGGAGRHVIDLSAGLASRGHRVHLVYSPARADPRYLDEIRRLPIASHSLAMRRSIGLHDLAAAVHLTRILGRQGPVDIVHGHSSKAGAVARMAAAGGAKRVYTPHAFRALDPAIGRPRRMALNGIERLLGRRTDALIAVSRGELDFARRHGIAPGRQHLILNGVVAPPSPERAVARGRLGLMPDDIAFGFIGRLTHQKAPERFVAAAATAMRAVPAIRAVVIDDGEYPDIIGEQIADSGLADRFIRIRGETAADYLAGLDVTVMTSRYEGLSYVLLETIAAHVPILTTAVAGVAEAIGDSNCGWVVPNGPDATASIAQAMIALARDPDRRSTMAAAAKARDAELNGDRMIRETERLYGDLLSGNARGV